MLLSDRDIRAEVDAGRMAVQATVSGTGFNEVTFLARTPGAKGAAGRWHAIGTDDSAPYRVFHDVADLPVGTRVQYRAVVLDNADHTRASRIRTGTVEPPRLAIGTSGEDGTISALPSSFTVPPHASAEVTVTWAPPASGPLVATLTVWSNDPAQPTVTTMLTGEAIPPPVAEVAYYTVPLGVVGRLGSFAGTACIFLVPRLAAAASAGRAEESAHLAARATRLGLCLTAAAAAPLLAIAPELLALWLGPAFSERALIIRWPILRSLAHTGMRPQWNTSRRASPSGPTTTP